MPEVIVRSHTIPDPEDKRKTKIVEEHRVEIFDKPEEETVIFLITGPAAFEGGPPIPLTPQEEHIAALKEKQQFEADHGTEIYQFHRDPLAGGMRPVRPVHEQLWRTNPMGPDGKHLPMRKEKFHMTAQGIVSQGKIGDVVEDEQGNAVIMKSNIQRGQATMISTPGWVGVYIGSRT